MLQCPSCDATLDQDFGMVTCANCKAVLMIDISGHVQMGSATPDEGDVAEGDDFSEVSGGFNDPQSFDEESGESFENSKISSDFSEIEESPINSPEESDPNAGGFVEKDTDDSTYDDPDDSTYDDPEDSHQHEMGGSLVDDGYPDASAEENVEPPQSESTLDDEDEQDFSMAQQPDPDPVDVTDYANSEESSLDDGEYLYDIHLARLDSKDLREAVKYMLMDEKLKLNHHEFMRKIKDGKLIIPDLNPIKAKRIAEQLQYLDLDIKWRQKRVILETVEPDPEFEDGEEVLEDGKT